MRFILSATLSVCLLAGAGGPLAATDGAISELGLTLDRQEGNVVVREAATEGPAFRAGVRPGDSILAVDGVPVTGATLEQVRARLLATRMDAISLQVRRASGGQQELRIRRPGPEPSRPSSLAAPRLEGPEPLPGPQSPGRPSVIDMASVRVGDPFIDFTLPRLGGGEVTLSKLAGKPIFMDFWATWCAPCRAEAPALAELARRYGDRVHLLGINMDTSPGVALGFIQSAGLDYPHLATGGWLNPVVQSYGIHRTGIPFNVLIDKHGRIAAMDLHGEPLARALETLLARD